MALLIFQKDQKPEFVFNCVCTHACMCVHAHVSNSAWKSEDNF